MAAYRKKPVVIDAVQWFPGVIVEGVMDLPEHVAIRQTSTVDLAWIETLEGGHIVSPGDWIITGINGEKYPVKDSIFAITYEPVEDDVRES